MNTKQPTIDDLFSDSGPFDEAAVVSAIQPFVTIQKSTNEIFFTKASLTVEEKIMVYGLAKKLLKIKGCDVESEQITGAELNKKTGIPKGSIDPAIKNLKDKNWLIGKGAAEIPTYKIPEIIASLKKRGIKND